MQKHEDQQKGNCLDKRRDRKKLLAHISGRVVGGRVFVCLISLFFDVFVKKRTSRKVFRGDGWSKEKCRGSILDAHVSS